MRAPDQTTIPLSRNDEYVRSFNWARVEFGIPLQTSPSHLTPDGVAENSR